jgi:protein-S-isoprenylcysteine O-methyltransferase Ste14
MEFFPQFEFSILGGWILLLIEWSIPILTLSLVSREIRGRLLDRANFSKKQKKFLIFSKIFSLILLILIFFTPLSLNSLEFYIGMITFIIGSFFQINAIVSFIKTPMNKLVTTGMYKVSRHPQDTSIFISYIGICLCIGSWVALLILFIGHIFKHYSVLAEEEECVELYGEAYKKYMEKIPRYILFF